MRCLSKRRRLNAELAESRRCLMTRSDSRDSRSAIHALIEGAGMLNRREFIGASLGVGAAVAAASVVAPADVWGSVSHRPLDPVNPDMLFGSTSSLWAPHR